MINSFGIEVTPDTADLGAEVASSSQVLTVRSVMQAAVPAIGSVNQDVKNAATKIVLDVQRLTGQVKEHHLSQLPEKTKEIIKEKIFSVQCEAEMNQSRKREGNTFSAASKGGDALAQILAAGQSINVVNIGEGFESRNESDLKAAAESFAKHKVVVVEKGHHKEWQEREVALNAMHECFEAAPLKIVREEQEFLVTCCVVLKNCLEENNIQIYLVGIQTASVFFQKALHFECVMEALPSLIRLVALRTTDTNTRVRKKSIDLVN